MEYFLKWFGRQNWIRFGIRDRIIRMYFNPDTISSRSFEINFFGCKYKGNLNSFVDWNVYFFGAYEAGNLSLYDDIIKNKKDPVFIDVGANVGHHSLYMSALCEIVHSFEPNPLVRSKLKEKIVNNSISNINVHGVGLGDKNEVLPFYAPKGCNQGTGSFINGYSSNNEEFGSLNVCNGDKFILNNIELKKIDLIKIDVEGFEKNVLIGIKETIEKYKPAIVLEFSEATKNSFVNESEFLSLLPDEYEVKKIIINKPYLFFFNKFNYMLDEFDFNNPGGDLLILPI